MRLLSSLVTFSAAHHCVFSYRSRCCLVQPLPLPYRLPPVPAGWLLFAVCPIAVFMAGARILDSLDRQHED